MKIAPRIFFDHPASETLFMEGNAAIFFKQVAENTSKNERYLAAHAFTQVLAGQLNVEDHEGNLIQVKAGEVIFLPKGIYFVSDLLPDKGNFAAMVYFFPAHMLENWASEQERLSSVASLFKFGAPPAMVQFSQSLQDLYLPVAPLNYILTQAKLKELLHLLGRSGRVEGLKSAIASLSHRKKHNLNQFMAANFDKPLGVEDYAYLSGRSVSTFQREFKRIFGEAPKQWLIQRRLEKASSLLRKGGLSVADVAAEVGYEDLSHFSKAFRKQFGLSPKQFAMQANPSIGMPQDS